MKKSLNNFYYVLVFILLGIQESFAANESDFPPSYYDVVALFLITVIILSFIALIYYEGKDSQSEKHVLESASIVAEHEHLLKNRNEDVKELVNNVPSWFMWLFYVTIFAAVALLIDYHVQNVSQTQTGNSQTEVKQAGTDKGTGNSGGTLNENTATLLTDPSSLNFGKQIFDANCVACHANDGGGLIGPNLTDDYWIHGGGIKNVFSVTKYGVPEKGMISWQSILSPKQIQEVASYVISLHGKPTANPKQPEGELWKESE